MLKIVNALATGFTILNICVMNSWRSTCCIKLSSLLSNLLLFCSLEVSISWLCIHWYMCTIWWPVELGRLMWFVLGVLPVNYSNKMLATG